MQNFNTQVGGSGPRIRIRIHQMDPRIRIRIQPKTSWIRNTGSGIVVLDYRFRSKVSLSSYRMKFVWLKSIRGLGQQAGKLNLKIELYFCGLNLNICGGGPRRGYYVHYVFYSYVVVLPPPPPPPHRLLQSFMYGRKTGRQAAGSQATGGQTDRRQIDRRQVCWRQATWE